MWGADFRQGLSTNRRASATGVESKSRVGEDLSKVRKWVESIPGPDRGAEEAGRHDPTVLLDAGWGEMEGRRDRSHYNGPDRGCWRAFWCCTQRRGCKTAIEDVGFMEAGACGCTGRRNTREMWVLTLTWLTACLCRKPASFLFRVLTSHSSHGEDPRPPCPGPIAELRKCNTSSLVKPPEEKGFHCHFTHQTCSLRKARFEPVVDRGVRDSFCSKMRQPFRTGSTWPLTRPQGKAFKRTLLGEKKKSGWGGGDVKNQKQKISGTTPNVAVELPGGQVLLLEAGFPLGIALHPCGHSWD